MTKPPKPPGAKRGRGAAGFFFVVFALLGGAGLALDLMSNGHGFWAAAQPGARTVIGVGAAALVMAGGHVGRFLLSRREDEAEQTGGRDAGDHA